MRRSRLILTGLLSTALVGTLGVGLQQAVGTRADEAQQPAAAEKACGLNAKLVPNCPRQFLFGASANPDGRGNGKKPWEQYMNEAQQRYQRAITIRRNFHPAGSKPPLTRGTSDGDSEIRYARTGTGIVMVNYKPDANWKKAASPTGPAAERLRQFARNVKAVTPHKVMIVLYHEPQNDVHHGSSCKTHKEGTVKDNTPATYRAMWRNARAIFDREGVKNAVWVMNYMGYKNWDCMVQDMWPGNDLVDWVAWDEYSNNNGRTWNQTIGHMYQLLTDKSDARHNFRSKPWMVGETGVSHCDRNVVRNFYKGALNSTTQNRFPKVKAYVWWDSRDEKGDFRTHLDCKGKSSPTELGYFRQFASNPLMIKKIRN